MRRGGSHSGAGGRLESGDVSNCDPSDSVGGGEEEGTVLLPKDAVRPSDALCVEAHVEAGRGDSARFDAFLAVEAKVSRALLPPLFCMVCLNFIDRTNLAFAALDLREEGMDEATYGLGSGLFFAGYALCQIPANLIVMRVPPPTWLAIITVVWGLCASSFALIAGRPGLFLALRLLIGVAESGAMPAMWYYVSLWYPSSRLTMPFAVVETAITVSQIIASPAAAGLLAMDGLAGLRGWQWLFLTEGVATMLAGVYLWHALPQNIASAAFLGHAEKHILEKALLDSRHQAPSQGGPKAYLELLRRAASAWQVWYAGVWRILHDIAGYGMLFWSVLFVDALLSGHLAPTEGSGEGAQRPASGPVVVLLTAIPATCASIAHLLNARMAQRTGAPRAHIAASWAIGSAALLLMPALAKVSFAAAFGGIVVAVTGANAANGVQSALVAAQLRGPEVAPGMAVYNTVATLGGLAGPALLGRSAQATQSYDAAMYGMGACLGAAALLVALFPRR